MRDYVVEIEQAYNKQRKFLIRASNLKDFVKEYRKIVVDDKEIDRNLENRSRIYIHLNMEEEEFKEDLNKIILGLGPIFEIALENHSPLQDDGRHLVNYRRIQEEGASGKDFKRISLGDSNSKEVSLAAILLYYYLIGEKKIRGKLSSVFEAMTEEIARGGYNSASYNGLEGYYFSKYFIKWLLDFRRLLKDENLYEEEIFNPLYKLLENLHTPYMEMNPIE